MNMLIPQQTAPVQSLLEKVKRDREEMIKLGMAVFGSEDAPMFPLDLMAFGAVKRNISTSSAFWMIVGSWNMLCARSLLRIHIDTSLRFSAAWLVEKPHELASLVLKGDRIDKMKDQSGKRLTDAYLVEARTSDYPWLPAVYKNLSGYIHFSGSHICDSVAEVDREVGTISFSLSETDLKFPESSWIEVLECFREATAMLATYLHGYRITKQLSTVELEAAKSANR
jgi:hypothetical protein